MEIFETWSVHAIKVTFVIVAATLLTRLVSVALASRMGAQLEKAHSLLFGRMAGVAIWSAALLLVLHEFGINLSVLLGAAGIATVALGFAAQTSASNLISGVFLLGDRAFALGDIIRVDTTQGEVVSVDQLSIKLRTPDNLMVRIPNETLIKASITNLTRWPIRRLDMPLVVSLDTDVEYLRATLFEIAAANPLCLVDPKPMMMFLELNESGLKCQFSVWVDRRNLGEVGVQLITAITRGFAERGIDFGAPRRQHFSDARSSSSSI